jgi:hypothetical protein
VEAAVDEAEQTVETERAGISGDATDGTPPHATDERQRRVQSETPSIKSPHTPIRGVGAARRLSRNQGTIDEGEEQQREAAGPSARAALETIEEETSEVEETATQHTTGTRRKSGHGSDRRGRPPRKRKGGYLDRLRPVMETMLGHLEFTLMTGMEEVPGELNDEEHDDAACPAIARMAMNKQNLFAMALMGDVHTWDQTKLFFIRHQWIEDRRKTKAETEERSVHECVIKVFKGLKCMTSKTGTEEDWRN